MSTDFKSAKTESIIEADFQNDEFHICRVDISYENGIIEKTITDQLTTKAAIEVLKHIRVLYEKIHECKLGLKEAHEFVMYTRHVKRKCKIDEQGSLESNYIPRTIVLELNISWESVHEESEIHRNFEVTIFDDSGNFSETTMVSIGELVRLLMKYGVYTQSWQENKPFQKIGAARIQVRL